MISDFVAALFLVQALPVPAPMQEPKPVSEPKPAPVAAPATDHSKAPPLPELADDVAIEPAAVTLLPDGTTIEIKGTIGNGSFFKLAELLRKTKGAKTVRLSSMGGLVREAKMMHNAVERRGLRTHVEYLCASACIDIFLAGRERTLATDAKLGFHQSYVRTRDGGVLANADMGFGWKHLEGRKRDLARANYVALGVDSHEYIRQKYAKLGISSAFTEKALSTKADRFWFPTMDELIAERIVTTNPVAPSPLPTDTGRSVVEGALALNIFWSTLRETEPALFGQSVDLIWRLRNTGMPPYEAAMDQRAEIIRDTLEPRIHHASDPVLAGFLAYYTEYAVGMATNEHAACDDSVALTDANAVILPDAIAREDRLFAALLRDQTRVEMTRAQADKIALKQMKNFVRKGLIQPMGDEPRARCKFSGQLFTAIATLDEKQRVELFRALGFSTPLETP